MCTDPSSPAAINAMARIQRDKGTNSRLAKLNSNIQANQDLDTRFAQEGTLLNSQLQGYGTLSQLAGRNLSNQELQQMQAMGLISEEQMAEEKWVNMQQMVDKGSILDQYNAEMSKPGWLDKFLQFGGSAAGSYAGSR